MAVGGFMTAGPILSIATHQMEDSVRRHAPGIMVDAVRQLLHRNAHAEMEHRAQWDTLLPTVGHGQTLRTGPG
eukprot:scaffold837_cov416-Prasinococcus_capsulatus_cf.AAC.5